jgi:hypothetical protein
MAEVSENEKLKRSILISVGSGRLIWSNDIDETIADLSIPSFK